MYIYIYMFVCIYIYIYLAVFAEHQLLLDNLYVTELNSL